MIDNPPPFKGLSIRISILIKGRGSLIRVYIRDEVLEYLDLGVRVFGFKVVRSQSTGRKLSR